MAQFGAQFCAQNSKCQLKCTPALGGRGPGGVELAGLRAAGDEGGDPGRHPCVGTLPGISFVQIPEDGRVKDRDVIILIK